MNEPQAPGLPNKDGKGKYVWLAAGGCALLLLFGVAVGFFIYWIFQLTGEPVKIVNLQLESIRKGNIEEAYSYCSTGFRQGISFQDFQEMLDAYPILRRAEEFSSSNREISSGIAKLNGTIKGLDGSKMPVTYQLVEEQDQWKIQQIQISNSGIVDPDENTQSAHLQVPAPVTNQPLNISNVAVQQENGTASQTVIIRFTVLNFQNESKDGSSRAHLIQDIQTIGPDGNIVPDLSIEGIKELNETDTFQEYGRAEFSNTLQLSDKHLKGKYLVNLTVHDRIGNQQATSTTEFEFQ